MSLALVLMLQSCVGCSNSGRSQLIARAKEEASKSKTKPVPNTIDKTVKPKVVKLEDIVTPSEKQSINKNLVRDRIPKAQGNLIQVEGLVLKEVMELNIKLNSGKSQIEQIFAMQKHVKANWHYIFDPETGKDTWRSAEATLSLKYKGQYSGDCDDFAILMASMARQIGLRSRMIGGFDKGDGHAFAEFLLPKGALSNLQLKQLDCRKDQIGIWVSLDWFNGQDHNRFTKDIIIFDDI
ncbi:transglutaminase-like domain-containing protein [Gaetbulibacter sp. PBL-D1]|uniref:transglutaminase-like domain-containing protein n=1 Tax=Gaetbulibacter sp. PBL-D1 TaxID=3422594 RepID=UPI003D2EE338